nr:hypothetical protein [Tanacetum cinerariifolium]
MDEAVVPHAQRLRIGRSNFRLLSDIKSKESTLQLVYDVLQICPFFKAFLVTTNVPEIYMQEFWATATVHHHVKHKNTKKSNEMYYPQFTKVIIHHFMSKDPSIPRKNKVNWHYVRDDHMFSTIKLNSNAYKEYYAIATGAAPPKPKASTKRTRSSSDTSITPSTAAASPRLTASAKGKQTAKASKAKSLFALSEDGDDDEEDEGDDGQEGNGDDDDEDDDGKEGDDDDADQEVVRDDDKDDEKEGNGDEDLGLNIGGEGGHIESEEEDELYRDININQGRVLQTTQEVEDSHVTLTLVNPDGQQQSSSVSSQFVTSMLNPTLDVGMESIFETTSQLDVQTPTSVAPLPMTAPTMTPSIIATITITSQAPILPTTVPSNILQNLPNFGSLFCFDDRLRSLEGNFFEAMQTNQFAEAVSAILGIGHQYMDQRMNEVVKVAVQIQSDRIRDEAQRENDEFLKTVDENMQKIIKE